MRKFFKRALIVLAVLYLAIAAYGRYHQQQGEGYDYVCPCDECDCGPPVVPPTNNKDTGDA